MSSKKRASTTDTAELVGLVTKMQKKQLTLAIASFMDSCEDSGFDLLDHLRDWNNVDDEQNNAKRVAIVIDALVNNRPTIIINLENLPTYDENPDVENAISTYSDHFKNNKKTISFVSVVCFGRYLTDAAATEEMTIAEYIDYLHKTDKLPMSAGTIRQRINMYNFLQEYPMFVNSNIGYSFVAINMKIIYELFGHKNHTRIHKVSTNNYYSAWCDPEITDDILHIILSA